MTTTQTPTVSPSYLERADNLLAQVNELGNLDVDKQTELLVAGTSAAKMQEARLHYASTLALCSVALTLERLEDRLRGTNECLSDLLELLAGRPDEYENLTSAFAAGIGAAMRGHEAQFHSVFGGVPVPVTPDEAGQ